MAAGGCSGMFAVTFGLLRQYVKEQKQQLMGGGLAGAFQPAPLPEVAKETTDDRTMQLFPTRTGTSQQLGCRMEAQVMTAPLTIFYKGQVVAFDDFPGDKARELMQLAGSWSTPQAPVKGSPALAVPRKPAAAQEPPLEDLSNPPISRKASLQRFQRMKAEKDPAAGKPVNDVPSPSWLGL